MANIMMQKDVRNKPHRNGFDLSRRICFTNKTGLLTPVNYLEVLPGDTFDIDLNSFMRTIPVNTASFARVREYYDVFFVPYSLLWDKWNAFITQTNQPTHAASSTAGAYLGDTHPYLKMSSIYKFLEEIGINNPSSGLRTLFDNGGLPLYYSSYKLLHNLGYMGDSVYTSPDSGWSDFMVNPFPLLAYQKIYQDYFRFTQWENSSPWTYNLDYMLTSSQREVTLPSISSMNASLAQNCLYTPRYCNYDKDLFFGIIPTSQYGEEAMVSVSSILPAQTDLFKERARLIFSPLKLDSSGSTYPLQVRDPIGTGSSAVGNTVASGSASYYLSGTRFVNHSTSDLASNLLSQFSVLAYRRAEASQKWKEITLSGDLDYVSQIQKHWGVTPPKTESYMCTRLGGTARNLDISEVVNNNLDSLPESFAFIKGKGILAQNGHLKWSNKTGQYGLIMVIHHCKPLIEWPQKYVFEKYLTKVTADSYAIPEFDQIGNEPIFQYQFNRNSLFEVGTSSSVTPPSQESLGYAPRYSDYKTSFDIARGAFLHSQRQWILPYDTFHSSDISGVLNPVSFKDFKVSVASTNPIFSVIAAGENLADDASDPYLCTCYMKCHVVRNLDRDGLPY